MRDKIYDITIIGPAIVDILAGPIDEKLFQKGTLPMDDIHLTYGGNAYNEAVILSRFGLNVNLISKIGGDDAGKKLLAQIQDEGINIDGVVEDDGISTGINIVLFDKAGERRFLTNPNGSLRKLSEEDIESNIHKMGHIVCFSCMFISPLLDIPAMERIFKLIKKVPNTILLVDMTKAKNGEMIDDLQPLFEYIDYIFPNEEELSIISGTDLDSASKELIHLGVSHVVLKRGEKGCRVYTSNKEIEVAPYVTEQVVDTTGAGDSFAAGFIYGLSQGFELEKCAKFANATASCCVERIGATEGIVSLEEPMRRFGEMK